MAARTEEHTEHVDAPPRECFALLADVERAPEWQKPLRSVSVLSRHPDGRPADVEYEIDAVVRSVRYRLRHHYEEPGRITSDYLGGDLPLIEGEWRFDGAGDGGTDVTFRMTVDAGIPVPGPIARRIEDRVLRRAVSDLKREIES